MTTRAHQEVQVGGDLNEQRLRQIMVRAYRLRNVCVSEREALEYKARPPGWSCHRSDLGPQQDEDGETPTLVWYEDDPDGERERIDLHVGCGEICPVLARIPYDGDSGGTDQIAAEAIAHAGRDLIDLVREVQRLREALARVAP